MRSYQWISARATRAIALALVLALSVVFTAYADARSGAVQAQAKLEATIFSFDGQDFVRTNTTLVTETGKPAVNTKLDRGSPAYKALSQKRSYTGDVTLFGRSYQASYAPLTGADGQVTGALFVAVAK